MTLEKKARDPKKIDQRSAEPLRRLTVRARVLGFPQNDRAPNPKGGVPPT